jgi:signal transduction histidine kinase
MSREAVARRKSGETFPIELTLSRTGVEQLITCIIRDISERKRLQQHVLEIAAEEQRRIGQELHDGTGQELTGLTLLAGSLIDLLDAVHPADASRPSSPRNEVGIDRLRETARKLCRKLTEANRNVHQLSYGIMPVQIDAEGLRAALEELTTSTDGLQGIRCSFHCPEPISVSDNTTATHLYRIAQEAVNNAVRHSQADDVQVSLRREKDRIILEVRDNGIGIESFSGSANDFRQGHGMGLKIMDYRASIIGGVLHVRSNEPRGTSIRCTIVEH